MFFDRFPLGFAQVKYPGLAAQVGVGFKDSSEKAQLTSETKTIPAGRSAKAFRMETAPFTSIYAHFSSVFIVFHHLFIFVFVESRFGWFRKRIWVLSAFWCSTAFLLEAKK